MVMGVLILCLFDGVVDLCGVDVGGVGLYLYLVLVDFWFVIDELLG